MTKRAVKTVADIFDAHSDLIAVKTVIVGQVKGKDGKVTEIELGQFSGGRRQFSKSGNFGFYAGGKLDDLTDKGQESQTKYQVGVNITAIKSAEKWL